MGRKCAVANCGRIRPGFRCHRLPYRDRKRMKLWLKFLDIDVNTPVKELRKVDRRVCGLHFVEEDYYQLTVRRNAIPKKGHLTNTAVPTRFGTRSEAELEELRTVRYEEGCPGITFDISEFTFDEDEEEEEEEEKIEDNDSDWENEGSDHLESHDSDGSDLDSGEDLESGEKLDSGFHTKVRQLCPDCGALFLASKTHTCEYKVKPLSCIDCGKRCVDKKSLKIHSAIHKESYEHPCKFCMVSFKTRLDKLAHEAAHIRCAKPYECPDCSMKFAKLHKRNLHLKGHRGPKYTCPHCALEFGSGDHLERHIVVHTGEKQFVCQFCSRSFTQQSHLTSHLRLHTGEKPFQCQHCDKSFNHNVSLKSHVMRYHKEGDPDSGPSGPVKRTKAGILKSTGRPRGRPKKNAATGGRNSTPAVQGEALDPPTAADPLETGTLRRASSKDIECDWSDRDPPSEQTEDDKTEESKGVRKNKREASQRPKTYHSAEKDCESDSDSHPEEEAKKRKVFKSQEKFEELAEGPGIIH